MNAGVTYSLLEPARQAEQLVLRDYQIASVEQLREGYRAGERRQMLCAPTGAGKTAIATHLMQEAYSKGTPTAFLVDRVSLVDQTSLALDRYGVPHGVVQAGHWRRMAGQPIQVCSAQTLERRGFFPGLKLLIVDECHSTRQQTIELIRNRPDLRVLGLTATPFTEGLSELYPRMVNVTTTNELIASGNLVPLKTYVSVRPNMDGAKVVAGEWTDKEIADRGRAILGDIVAEWQAKTREHFGGPVKTIVFAASVDHGAELCEKFGQAGYNFQQISYKDGDDGRRRELIDEFRKPDSSITGLVACEVFTKGFDVPDTLCGISARPYRKSFSSHIQQIGRVMRPAPGKTFALWLDHSGNMIRFQRDQERLFEEGPEGLMAEGSPDKKQRKDEEEDGEGNSLKCGQCHALMPGGAMTCPQCGWERPRRVMVEQEAGVMVAIGGKIQPAVGQHAWLQHRDAVWRMLATIALQRKGDLALAQRFAQAQYRQIYGEFAHRKVESTKTLEPTAECRRMVQANMIRYQKAREAALREAQPNVL